MTFIPETYQPGRGCAVCGKPDPAIRFRNVPAGPFKRLISAILRAHPWVHVCSAECLAVAAKVQDYPDRMIAARFPVAGKDEGAA